MPREPKKTEFSKEAPASLTPRQRRLLGWLRDDSADSLDILNWLNGDWSIFREEEAHEAVYESLPSRHSPEEEFGLKNFIERIGDAITALSEDIGLRDKQSQGTWAQLFALASESDFHDSEDPSIPTSLASPIKRLLTAFDHDANDGKCRFATNPTNARAFTRLVIANQADNNLRNRWLSLIEQKVGIEGGSDPVFEIGLQGAVGGLLAMPRMVDQQTLTTALRFTCKRIENAQNLPGQVNLHKSRLAYVVAKNYPRYLTCASIWDALIRADAPDTKYATLEFCIHSACTMLDNMYSDVDKKRDVVRALFFSKTDPSAELSNRVRLALAFQWTDFPWLPMPNLLLYTIATIRDIGALSQLTAGLEDADHKYAKAAKLMLNILLDDSDLALDLKLYLEKRGKGRITVGEPMTFSQFSNPERSERRINFLSEKILQAFSLQCREINSSTIQARLDTIEDFIENLTNSENTQDELKEKSVACQSAIRQLPLLIGKVAQDRLTRIENTSVRMWPMFEHKAA